MRVDQADVILSRGIASFPIHAGPRASGRACGDRDAKHVLMSLPWFRTPGNGQQPGRTYAQVPSVVSGGFVRLAAGLRLRSMANHATCGRIERALNQTLSPDPALVPAPTDLAPAFVLSQGGSLQLRRDPTCGEGKERRLRSDNARASSGHHDMGASAAPVPTVRPLVGPGVTEDDYFPYMFVIFPRPTQPATLSTVGRRRRRSLHICFNIWTTFLYWDN